MKAELSFTFDSLEDLQDFTAKMAKSVPVQVTGTTGYLAPAFAQMTSAVAEEPRASKVRKTKVNAGPDSPTPEAALDLVAKQVVEGLNPATVDDVRAAISRVNEKFGLVPARKVLNRFGVKRIPELKPEQYAAFVEACSKVQ